MQNDKGQGVSHATDSQVPQKVQEKVPSKLEHELPDVSTLVSIDLHPINSEGAIPQIVQRR